MSRIKNILVPVLFLLGWGFADAQNSKADRFFDHFEYSKAIPLYKRSAGKNDASLKKLADCYRLTKNYREAEVCYAKLVSKRSTDPKVYYYYGEALLNNNKYEEAKKQFSVYSTLDPDDSKGDEYAKACDDIKVLLEKPGLYKIYNLGEINSKVSDFCPVFYKEGIVFASERAEDLVNFNDNKWTGNPYLTLIYAKGSKTGSSKNGADSVAFQSGEIFYKRFNGKGHFGPACFNSDYSEMFFTKVGLSSGKGNDVNRPQLYWAKEKEGWHSARLLPFCNPAYATGHPSLSKDGQYLYFSSGMPGGQGGTDIWVCKREGDAWGVPQNLGPEVNTKEDESFPSICADNTLYFSSAGHRGYGGLDIYSAVQLGGHWGNVKNLLTPINSSADDFGIIFKNDNSGYFSSNRSGGKGSDDLYGFVPSGIITNLAGKILLSSKTNDGAKNVKVWLFSNGNQVGTTTTDDSGLFRFENLSADQTYNIKVDETDPNLINQRKIYLADSRNRIIRIIVRGKDGFFVFENLPPDLSKLSEISEADAELKNISIAGNFYAGDQHAPVENTKVSLVNEKGEVLESTTTNSFGSFVFMNISADQNLTVVLDESDPELAKQKIYFTNKSGKEIAMKASTPFKFTILATDKQTLSLLTVEDSQLLVDLNGTLFSDKEGKNRIANSDILLMDEKGNTVGTGKTDVSGNFKFTNLPADQNYLVKLNEKDPALAKKDIFLADSHGKIVATLRSASGKYFKYYALPADEQSIAKIYFNDPWLKVAEMNLQAKKDSMITIIENIYYEYQKWELPAEAMLTMNKVINVMKANKDISINILSHTDSRGSDEFNMKLSQKRAQAAVDYMVSKGIERKRLNPIGKGETKLVNRCKDGVECSEEEHAQNRRTEFNIRRKNN